MNLKAEHRRGLRQPPPRRTRALMAACSALLFAQATAHTLADAADAQAAAPAPAVHARVQGIVFDSTSMRPLTGALVQLVLASDPMRVRSVTTSADGAFRFDTVAVGSWLLGFFHARLDSVAFDAPMLRVDVRDSSEIRAPLVIPSQRSIVAKVCGPGAAKDSTGLFAGAVRSATGGGIQGKGHVRVQWAEIIIGSRGLERRAPSVLAATNDDGEFAVCGIPLGSLMMTRASAGPDSSGYAELELPLNGYLHRMLYVSSPERVVSTDTGRPSLTVLRGPSSIRGTIRSARGETIAGARVSVWGTGLEATTDARGEFRLTSLPLGTYTLEVRAIGFELVRRPIDILPSDAETVVALAPIVRMDTMRVTATRLYTSRALEAFEQRRKRGMGYFLDEAAIEKRNPFSIADLLRTTPGVVVAPGGMFGDQVLMRGGSGMGRGFCAPTVLVDGVRMMNDDGNIDAFVNPTEVRAVEVYSRVSSVPAEFQAMNNCGTILIWTGARNPTSRQ